MTSLSCRAALVILAVAVAPGCYAFYPHGFKRAVPPRVEANAKIRLEARDHTSWSSCTSSDDKCEVHDGEIKSSYQSTRYYPYYGDVPITLGQLRALLDGDSYTAAWDKIERKKGTCKISIPPTVIYFVGALATVVGITLSKNEPDSDMRTYSYIAGAVTGGAALLSYPLGGYACMQAKSVAEGIEVNVADSPYATANGRDIDELQRKIDAFNRGERPGRNGTETPTRDTPAVDTPTEATPHTDEPPADDGFVPGTLSIMKTLATAGDYTQFSAILVETGIDRELASGGPYTVAALNDRAFAKVKDKLAQLDKAERVRTFRDLIFVGVVTSGERALKTLGGTTLTLEVRKNGYLKVRGKSGALRLVAAATNGVVYVVE